MRHTFTVLMALVCIVDAAAFAHAAPQAPAAPPTTAAAEVTACAQAQMVVDSLLADATRRLESGRQSNNPVDLRAAVDALQTTIRDVRAQLVVCAKVDAADPHAGHTMTPAKPPAKPPATTTKPPTKKPPV